MKSRVAIWTACVLSALLLIFDTFIYVNLYNHLLRMEQTAVDAEVQAISQYSPDNANDSTHSHGTRKASYNWLYRFAKIGQTIVVVDTEGRVLGKYGNRSASSMVQTLTHMQKKQLSNVATLKDGTLFEFAAMQDGDINHSNDYVLLASNLTAVKSYMKTLLILLIVGSIGAIALAAIGGYAVSAIAVRPINQMIRLVERIQVNNLGERVDVASSRGEVARLAITFNNMLNRMERSFSQQSQFVADASHEIRTPLTTIQGYANLLGRWGKTKPDVLDKGIRVIQKESNRMRNVTEDLLTLASLDISVDDMPKRANVSEIIAETVDSASFLHDDATIQTDLQSAELAAMSPAHLKRIVTNVLDNAIKYSKPNANIVISSRTAENTISIAIEDDGQGIPASDLPHIFDRFYRVDKSRTRREGGSGLGLAIVKELVEAYGGTIRVDSTIDVGTKATVTVPAI